VTLSTVAATGPLRRAPSVQQRNRDTTAMYPNNDSLGEGVRLCVEENFHDS
jgi:hypothetical protein